MPVKSRKGPSVAFSLVILPSKTNSQSAGTSRSTVLHFTKSVFSSAFAMLNSSVPIGRVVAAASRVAVELPRQIAMSSSPPAFAKCGVCASVFHDAGDKVVFVFKHQSVEAHVAFAGFGVFDDGDG